MKANKRKRNENAVVSLPLLLLRQGLRLTAES